VGHTITLIAGMGLLVGTVVFVNTTEGRRWLENRVETARWITNQAQPRSATAAPHYPQGQQRQRRSTP
jgi:hypothetical protein